MKYLTILLTIFALKTCDSSEQLINKSKMQDMTLSGVFTVTTLEKTSSTNNLTLEFDALTKKVSGFSGCNRYFGSYTINKDSISIGPLASTRKYCIGEANAIELKFQTALSKVNNFIIENNEISLLNDTEVLIKANKNTNNDEALKELGYVITYSAFSRGFYKTILFNGQSITFQNNRNDRPTIYKCTKEDLARIDKHLKSINLKALPELESHTKAHQYDGAAGAILKIEYSGKTYETVTFDHGNPPEQISELINLILALTESI